MDFALYFRLITLTAGTLVPFFWMIVILGHRRQRNFERIFFFLCLGLTLSSASSLLALNAQLYYGVPPSGLLRFAWTSVSLGLWFLPALVVHLHLERAGQRGLLDLKAKWVWLAAAYLPALCLSPRVIDSLGRADGLDFETPLEALGTAFLLYLFLAILAGVYWQTRFRAGSSVEEQKLHGRLRGNFLFLAALVLLLLWGSPLAGPARYRGAVELFCLWGVLAPLIVLIKNVPHYKFLQIGRQRNLIYAVFGTFLALLYLSLVRRASLWFEPHLPPEATAALLLFLPVVFFEPLQRRLGRYLRQTAEREVERAQKLLGPINDMARRGDLERLHEFVERFLADQLQLAEAKLDLGSPGTSPRPADGSKSTSEEALVLLRSGHRWGCLWVKSHGAMISGETYAALEMVGEQLPGAFELCRLIGEKLRLERELAERERLALVGQMAASISHNLKNPLGSMKTILEVQLESPDLPGPHKEETRVVLGEINRLSDKLDQLLQFSRTGVRPERGQDRSDVALVARTVCEVLRHEAEQRSVTLAFAARKTALLAAACPETVNDVLSNVVLNAIEAVGAGGRVWVRVDQDRGRCAVNVEDDGPGIPPELREKILEPFFTTKSRGTGLGLAIVARRLAEVGGTLEIASPIREGRGSRFCIFLPSLEGEHEPCRPS